MTLNLADSFLDDLIELSSANFSSSDIQASKNFLLDYLGVTIAGAHILKDKGDKLMKIFQDEGKSSVIGFSNSSSVQTAIFVNGLSSHVAELDDGVISGSVHPGAPLFSALLTVCESQKISAKQLLIGIIVGYEAIIRLADTIQPSHKEMGYHATATCGAIGASLGLSIMLGLSKEQIKNAFSCAIISASGTLKAIEDNSELKPLNVANAALNAYYSTMMANAGFQGPDNPLSGKRGFLNVMSTKFNKSSLLGISVDKLKINNVYVKPYAACRYCHPAIDAVLIIREKHSIEDCDVKQIKVETYKLAVNNHDHVKISSISSAKMSIPFSVAVALKTGKAGILEFSDNYINDFELSKLTEKVSVTSNEGFTKNFPQKSQSSVEIITNEGDSYFAKVDFPKGEPENPLSQQELTDKYKVLTSFAGKKEAEALEIVNVVTNLENRLNDLYPLL